jgi:hypothetical protein
VFLPDTMNIHDDSALSVFFMRGLHRSRFGVNASETFGYAGPVFDERPQEWSNGTSGDILDVHHRT